MTNQKATTTAQGRDLILTRTFAAPPEKIFNAWTETTLFRKWFAPLFWTTAKVEAGVRVGCGKAVMSIVRPLSQKESHVKCKAFALCISVLITFPSIAQTLSGTISQMNTQHEPAGRYATVNGLNMYYEIHGSGRPLVLVHGGGSTIKSTFGRVLPRLAKTHQVIAVELQAHGHTKDINRPLSFEQDADDVAALLKQLRVEKADFMAFSNGATTCIQVAIRDPNIVNKLVLASATYKRSGMPPGFFEGFKNASLKTMPRLLQEAYLKANPDPKGLQSMFDRDVARMAAFKDISDSDIKSIQAPTLVLNGDADVVLPEHALELSRTLPHARLAILPGGHGHYIGEIESPDKNSKVPIFVATMIEDFLKE